MASTSKPLRAWVLRSAHTQRRDGQANTLTLRARQAFMSTVVSGSATTLRRKIVETVRTAQFDGIMFMFPDFIDDQRILGECVLPGVREDLVPS